VDVPDGLWLLVGGNLPMCPRNCPGDEQAHAAARPTIDFTARVGRCAATNGSSDDVRGDTRWIASLNSFSLTLPSSASNIVAWSATSPPTSSNTAVPSSTAAWAVVNCFPLRISATWIAETDEGRCCSRWRRCLSVAHSWHRAPRRRKR
jgi:hypothetical protein